VLRSCGVSAQRCEQLGGKLASKKTTGLSLRIADLSSAFAFAGVLQATSCTPGMAWK